MRNYDCGAALYPPPKVGGFTAMTDKIITPIKLHQQSSYINFVIKRKGRYFIPSPIGNHGHAGT